MKNKQNFLWASVTLTEESQELLKKSAVVPNGWKWYGHHMTIIFGQDSLTPELEEFLDEHLGQSAALITTSIGRSSRAYALGIVTDVPCANEHKHITLATAPEAKPVESNDIEAWSPIEPVVLEGTIEVHYTYKPRFATTPILDLPGLTVWGGTDTRAETKNGHSQVVLSRDKVQTKEQLGMILAMVAHLPDLPEVEKVWFK